MDAGVDELHTQAETEFSSSSRPKTGNRHHRCAGNVPARSRKFPGTTLEAILHPKLRGLRRILHVVPDAVSQTPLFLKDLALVAKHQLTFDLCLLARQLPLGAKLARQFPGQQFILDHCGVPDTQGGGPDPWRQPIRDLSKFPASWLIATRST
jgi:predicted TIM-barrel fold metal-dependent hydrolase